jgi:hypothetical protein
MEKKLYFNNSRGDKLCGILTDPSGDKTKPVIVLSHGFNSSKDSHTCKSIAKKLREKNISTFRFDFYAHGESEGNFIDLTVSEAVDDTLRAVDFLKTLGYERIGLFGSSFGGLSSYVVASKSRDLFLLIQKAPVASFKDIEDFNDRGAVARWKKSDYRTIEGKKLKYAFYEDAIKNNAYEVAEQIKVPTLIIHGNQDQDVPIVQSINITKYIQNCALEIVVGADHRFSKKDDFEQLLNSILTFVTAHSHQRSF